MVLVGGDVIGYSHYFKQVREATVEEWSKIIEDTNKIIDGAGVPLWAEYTAPNSSPTVNEKEIVFNGCGDDGHETFFLQREKYNEFNFCKTARKPYDVVVCAILIAAEHHAPGAWDIGSDGDYSGEGCDEWGPALKLANRLLGEKVINDIERQYKMPPGVR